MSLYGHSSHGGQSGHAGQSGQQVAHFGPLQGAIAALVAAVVSSQHGDPGKQHGDPGKQQSDRLLTAHVAPPAATATTMASPANSLVRIEKMPR